MSSAPLRKYIYALPNHHSDDISAYEEYAEHDGWDLDTLCTPESGVETATRFLDNFLSSGYSSTKISSSDGVITVQKLYDFLQQLIQRNPRVAQLEVNVLKCTGFDQFDDIQLMEDDNGDQVIAFSTAD